MLINHKTSVVSVYIIIISSCKTTGYKIVPQSLMPPYVSSLPANQEDRNRRLHKPANQKKASMFYWHGVTIRSPV